MMKIILRESIMRDLGVYCFYRVKNMVGTQLEHRVNFKTLTYLSNMKDVVVIKGSRSGPGRSSIGPRLERDEHDKTYGPDGGKA